MLSMHHSKKASLICEVEECKKKNIEIDVVFKAILKDYIWRLNHAYFSESIHLFLSFSFHGNGFICFRIILFTPSVKKNPILTSFDISVIKQQSSSWCTVLHQLLNN